MKPKTGICPVCGYRVRLSRVDRLILNHWIYYGKDKVRCQGGWKEPRAEPEAKTNFNQASTGERT